LTLRFPSSTLTGDESLIKYFNIIFDFILFRFKFILFSYYFLLDLFYVDCILLYFRNEYLIDSVLEQKKEDSKLIWAGKIQDSAQKYNLPSQKLGTACAISHTAVPHPIIALLLYKLPISLFLTKKFVVSCGTF